MLPNKCARMGAAVPCLPGMNRRCVAIPTPACNTAHFCNGYGIEDEDWQSLILISLGKKDFRNIRVSLDNSKIPMLQYK